MTDAEPVYRSAFNPQLVQVRDFQANHVLSLGDTECKLVVRAGAESYGKGGKGKPQGCRGFELTGAVGSRNQGEAESTKEQKP